MSGELHDRYVEQLERAVATLRVLARREHDDGNRGCAKAWGTGVCTCGADAHNAEVDAVKVDE